MAANKDLVKNIIWRVLVVMLVIGVASIFIFEMYKTHVQKNMEFTSRYTFSIDIDKNGNVVTSEDEEESETSSDNENTYNFTSMSTTTVADTWIDSFLDQFTGIFVPRSKKLSNVKINDTTILDESTRTCLISFNANVVSQSSEYFSTWDGVTLNGKLTCEWVVTFSLVDHYDNTATVYVSAIQTPEDYGISQYDESIQNSASTTTVTSNTSTDELSSYNISNSILYVSYNGSSSYIVVPVDIENLIYDSSSSTSSSTSSSSSDKVVLSTSYMISQSMTAFVYGGKSVNGNYVPLSVIYSNDKGTNWTTYELSSTLNSVDFAYVNFVDTTNGFIVVGYDSNYDTGVQSSIIYRTTDGGETWTEMGNTPLQHPIKGVLTTDNNTIFICYYYNENYVSNLYVSHDGGTTFSNIILEDQELDSSAASSGSTTLTWSDVYKDALVPILEDDSTIVVYLSQGDNATYNDGKTAAKYASSDNGVTWNYVGQLEINVTE
jgi:hypothetical protein